MSLAENGNGHGPEDGALGVPLDSRPLGKVETVWDRQLHHPAEAIITECGAIYVHGDDGRYWPINDETLFLYEESMREYDQSVGPYIHFS